MVARDVIDLKIIMNDIIESFSGDCIESVDR